MKNLSLSLLSNVDMVFSSLQFALEKRFLEFFVVAFGITSEGGEKVDFPFTDYIEEFTLPHKKANQEQVRRILLETKKLFLS